MSNEKSKAPTFDVFIVEERGKNSYWTNVGALWPHKDGKGFNGRLRPGLALTGEFVIREREAKEAPEDADDDIPLPR